MGTVIFDRMHKMDKIMASVYFVRSRCGCFWGVTMMPDSTIVVRPARATDLPLIIALDREIFGAYGADEDPAVIDARLAVFPQGCVVLEEAATFLGYLTTEKWAEVREPALDENPHQSHKSEGRILNITTLVVGSAFQQRGLGGYLIQAARAIAQQEGCTQIILETARAEAFYRKHGFTKIGERQQRGIQLHIMQLPLPENNC